jgi:hypothetical protein
MKAEPIQANELMVMKSRVVGGSSTLIMSFSDQAGKEHRALFEVQDYRIDSVMNQLNRMRVVPMARGVAIPCTTA